jgi:hypothetical protein
MRRAALAAARRLNWQHEKGRLIEAVATLSPGARGRAAS